MCFVMACSHRRHGRDKTVLSCLQLCLHRQRDKTRQFCHVSNCVHTADVNSSKLGRDWWKLGRDETKLSCRLCEQAIVVSQQAVDANSWVVLHVSSLLCSQSCCYLLFQNVMYNSSNVCSLTPPTLHATSDHVPDTAQLWDKGTTEQIEWSLMQWLRVK